MSGRILFAPLAAVSFAKLLLIRGKCKLSGEITRLAIAHRLSLQKIAHA